jgi:hypothetical protein
LLISVFTFCLLFEIFFVTLPRGLLTSSFVSFFVISFEFCFGLCFKEDCSFTFIVLVLEGLRLRKLKTEQKLLIKSENDLYKLSKEISSLPLSSIPSVL